MFEDASLDPHLFFTLTDPGWSTFYEVLACGFIVVTIITMIVCWYQEDEYRRYQ
jgi:hypothetical protein